MGRPLFPNERVFLGGRVEIRAATIRALGIELSLPDLDDVDAAPIEAAKETLERLQRRDETMLELGTTMEGK